MSKVKVVEDYGTHKYDKEYEKRDLFCPKCGTKNIWEETGEGDYYMGSNYLCINCNTSSHLDGVGANADEVYLNVIEQIKAKL